MARDKSSLAEIAQELVDSERNRIPIPPIRDRLMGIDNAAYAVQRRATEIKVAGGGVVRGRKIGLTSKVVQNQLGVSQPDYGALFDDRIYGDGAELRLDSFIAPRVEGEIAFVLDRDITSANANWTDIIMATAFVMPALEIVDSRIAGWDIGFDDTVADNASFGACILGGPARRIKDIDLTAMEMALTADEELVSQGAGAACLGNPINAVVWLARKLSLHGEKLQAGDIVLSGALGPMVPGVAGATYQASIDGLGQVCMTFGA